MRASATEECSSLSVFLSQRDHEGQNGQDAGRDDLELKRSDGVGSALRFALSSRCATLWAVGVEIKHAWRGEKEPQDV